MTEEEFLASLPKFNEILPEKIFGDMQHLLTQTRQHIELILNQHQAEQPSFTNILEPIEKMNDEIHQKWSPISHLHSVKETEKLREAYNQTLPLLTQYYTDLMQNEMLFKAITSIKASEQFGNLSPAQQKIIDNDLRDFKLNGIHLPTDKKKEFAQLEQNLSHLTTKFSQHVLDATQSWTLHITDKNLLNGLPQQALDLAQECAKQRKLSGYLLTLEAPSYLSSIRFLHDRTLRKTIYEAYSTRASDQGPQAHRFDNSQIIDDILKTRHQIAACVGFENYAEYSLQTKMAKSSERVLNFLNDLLEKSKPIAQKEFAELSEFALQLDGIENLETWDIPYYSEKLCESVFHFTQEDLRPYFPIEKVREGLFRLIQQLYGITLKKVELVDVWHEDVNFYTLYDANQHLIGGLYMDLYARPHKRDGAWMDDCLSRKKLTMEHLQLPVAYLTCNFMQPVHDKPALLTHDDVLTLFHECGHCLHHLLTEVNYPSVGGIHGVPWDAVEFPSQFMEYFCWEKKLLTEISSHYQTQESLPQDLYEKMLQAKHFQTGLHMLRQLEFALFDFHLHLEYKVDKINFVQDILNRIRSKTCVYTVPDFNRFQHSFSHIFSGGYAAGYYSYKWAEVLSADAYSKFADHGIFNHEIGTLYRQNVLAVGGVKDPLDAFIAFRGREPSIEPLLMQSGIQ